MSAINNPGTGTPLGTSANFTTGTLAPGARQTGTVALGKTFVMVSIQVSAPARVELYSTSAAQAADVNRPNTMQPALGTAHGVICDFYLTAAQTFLCSPSVLGCNGDVSQDTNIYYAVTNIGSTSAAITVTFIYVTIES